MDWDRYEQIIDDYPVVTAILIVGLFGVFVLLPCAGGVVWLFRSMTANE